jgi:hypothetical protein
MPTPPIYLPIPPGTEPPEPGDGNSPAHPIVLPPGSNVPENAALVHVFVPGVGGVWFIVEAKPPVPTHPIAGQPPGTPKPA